jgi:hypothetical protein
LESHPESAVSLPVDGHADDAPGEVTFVLVADRQERRMGSAISERNPKSLRIPEHRVRAECGRGGEERETQEISGHRNERSCGVRA